MIPSAMIPGCVLFLVLLIFRDGDGGNPSGCTLFPLPLSDGQLMMEEVSLIQNQRK